MIEISNLTKIYRAKKRKNHCALKNINLTLPDKGLVFVLGKSGSGKSTLLNLIGGLDNITSGKIVVDGNDLSGFSEGDFCNYRNSHIGFIFQDYHLIEELTVYDNILLSLNLSGEKDGEKVKSALAKVDLAGYEDRYPSELSGGEQQRVAIARTIVKNPRVILADEPTGNLDTVTAKRIVQLLKELSKERLILIVSHNINDATNFADRIIELKKGEIILDKSRNPDFADEVKLIDGKLVYPQGLDLSSKDIATINGYFAKEKSGELVKRTDKFLTTGKSADKPKKIEIENKKFPFLKILRLSAKFLKNKALTIAVSSFMVAVIMIIMALAQTIIAFNANEVIQSEMIKSNQTSLLANKVVDEKVQNELDKDYRVAVDETDIQSFYDAGYQGKIYPVYNTTFAVTATRNYLGVSSANFSTTTDNFYLNESFGTLAVDEAFLERKFGKVEYLACAEEEHGLIITDYLADACITSKTGNYRGKTYQDLVGRHAPMTWTYSNLTVKGVIKTNYKERHKAFFDKAVQNAYATTEDMYNDADFLAFLNEIYDCLGYSYSLDPDYAKNAYLDYAYFPHYKLVCEGGSDYPNTYANPLISFLDAPTYTKALEAGEASMSMRKYNEIFGTDYTPTTIKNFVPRKLKISSYAYYDLNNEKTLFTTEITIKKLHTASDTFIFSETVSAEQKKFFGQATTYAYGLYFDGAEGIGAVLENMEKINYKSQGSALEGIRMMTRAVEVFIPIFELVAIFLCVGVIFILVNFSSKMINDKMKEIGILKALGVKNALLSLIFGLQILLIALLTCVMTTAGQYLFIDLANDVLIESLKKLASSYIVMDLQFLTFQSNIAVANCMLIWVLSIVSLVFPMVKIKEIKPVKIIKARE